MYIAPSDFAGIYMAELILPARCWGEEGEKVYFHSEHGSFVDVVCVDTVTKEVHYLSGQQEQQQGTYAVLDVAEGLIVVKYSNLSTAPQMVSNWYSSMTLHILLHIDSHILLHLDPYLFFFLDPLPSPPPPPPPTPPSPCLSPFEQRY